MAPKSRHFVLAPLTAAALVAASAAAASPLDGRWTGTATLADLEQAGVAQPYAGKLCGTATGPCAPAAVSFGNGRFRFHSQTGGNASGTFGVNGKHVRFVFASGVGVQPGTVAECGWSVYRDRLSFTKVRGRPCYGWDAAPWRRG